MSLLDEFIQENGRCVLLDRRTASDGEGGYTSTWEDGAEFDCAITFDTSMEARIGEQQGVTSRYTVTTSRTLVLQFNDYFRRLRDGKIFHVTSDGDDVSSPRSSTLDIRQVTAEEITALPS